MKYNIHINQKAVIDLNLDLDVVDMAIFDFIKDFSNSTACQKILIGGKQYFWITHSKIISDLPIIRINSRQGILKRINKLIVANLIDRVDGDSQRSYYCFGVNYDNVTFVTDRQQPLSRTDNESLPKPDNESCRDNITINNNTKDNKQILFSNSIWNSYEALKMELAKDLNFVKEFAGVDLKSYIEDCLAWSVSKNNKSTNNGWYLTLRKWMRDDRKQGKLAMLTQPNKPKGHTNH